MRARFFTLQQHGHNAGGIDHSRVGIEQFDRVGRQHSRNEPFT
ncbi:Uncharacterised protein [Mycobacteroides abscessus subsp. abscessus]|nr:Uncharacterised protein [Mycobacteroides abscessus subsp. abscessus]